MKIKRLLGPRVVVEVKELEKKTAAGILLSARNEPNDIVEGEVMVVGTGRDVQSVGHIDVDVAVGDKVLFQYGTRFDYDGKFSMLVNEDDIISVVE